jgi:hypothetical protein
MGWGETGQPASPQREKSQRRRGELGVALYELPVGLDRRFIVSDEGTLAMQLGLVIKLTLARLIKVHAESGKSEAQSQPTTDE